MLTCSIGILLNSSVFEFHEFHKNPKKQYRVKGQLASERYSSEKGIGTDGYQSQFLVDRMNRATRRDDLISAMYTLLHYYLPLPWLDGKVYNEDEKVNFRREYSEFSLWGFFVNIQPFSKSADNRKFDTGQSVEAARIAQMG